MADRPHTTLFLIQSLDGKISTGNTDNLDVDKDFSRIVGVKEGLQQYYDLEKLTDRVSLNSGRVMAKVGINEKEWTKETKDDIDFVVIDNKPHLNEKGCEYFAKRSQTFFLITTNNQHPAIKLKDKYPNIIVFYYPKEIDFVDAFRRLKQEYSIERMTIQTGGTLNAVFLRRSLIDEVSVVVAPCLIGGTDTQSLVGDISLSTEGDLKKIRVLKLKKSTVLDNSYLHLQYEVLDNTVVESKK